MMRFLGNNVAKVISKNIVFVLFVSKILSPLLVIEIEGTNLQICRLQNRNISSATVTATIDDAPKYLCRAVVCNAQSFFSFCFRKLELSSFNMFFWSTNSGGWVSAVQHPPQSFFRKLKRRNSESSDCWINTKPDLRHP
ncbi:expressed protein [Arabidopsis lyrata subsp. lyrata]|uniref:Expressed protein n=1 Tax=Arabidopsis lyrata subsp. lyrata TaxID=81972 RepID=D7MD25_ARALL|nr:expressed protein [Arabidopsis lyrata subsp. lyrata]